MVVTIASDLSRLESLKNDIRSLLISRNSCDITLPKLNKIYKDVVDEDIPYKDFHFTSLEKFLRSMPDVLSLKLNKENLLCAYHIDTEKSKHITSLVARERSKTNSNSESKFKVYHVNPIDPRILGNVLKELQSKNYSMYQNTKNSIRKTDVLMAVKKQINTHTFYTIKDLNSQLNECTHILTHDDNYIYFKNILNNINELQNIGIENSFIKLEEANKKMIKVNDSNLVRTLIKESTKIRLEKLIEKHAEGIWCSELPKIYQKEYGISLEYSDIGFNSVIEFASTLSDIFQIVEPLNTNKFMLLSAKTMENYLKNQESNSSSLERYYKNAVNEPSMIFTPMLHKIYKALIPPDVVGIDGTVDQIRVNSLMMDPIKTSRQVIISEVHNPSFFWITLHKNKKKITKLMNKLQNFYTLEDHNYKIPHEILKPGLHVACIFAEIWHRGIIKEIKVDGLVVVHFYDYGTSSIVTSDQLYFLNKKFSVLPAQAIPCSLNNVKPVESTKWSKKVNKLFTKTVFNKSYIAHIISTDCKNNSMIIDLVVRNSNVDKSYISQWMLANQLAKSGKFLCQIKNFTFAQHQQYLSNNYNR